MRNLKRVAARMGALMLVFSVMIAGAGNPPGGGARPGGPRGGGPGGPPAPPMPAPVRPPAPKPPPPPQIYLARSPDGLLWTPVERMLFDHASAPSAILRKDGTLLVYFVNRPVNTISVGISTDLGLSWDVQDVAIRNQTSRTPTESAAVETSDRFIRLYFLDEGEPEKPPGAPPETPRQYGIGPESGEREPPPHKIYSALSRDGVHFIEEPGVRLAQPGITRPDLLRAKKWWRMYLSVDSDVLSAYSQNGVTWVMDKGERAYFGARTGTIELPDGRFRMYVSGNGIESMISSDGLDWQYEDGVRLPPPPRHTLANPSVIHLPDGSYLMFFDAAELPAPPGVRPPGPPGPPPGGGPNNPPPPPK